MPRIKPLIRQNPDIILTGGAWYIQNPNLPWFDPGKPHKESHQNDTASTFDYFGIDAAGGDNNSNFHHQIPMNSTQIAISIRRLINGGIGPTTPYPPSSSLT